MKTSLWFCFCFFGGFLNLLKAWCLCLSQRNLDLNPPRIDSCIWCRETPVLWPPHAKSWLIGKDSDAGRDWGQEEKGTTQDEMAGWHHWLDGRESEWTPGVGDGQGGLACCDSWGRKESDTTERLNWTDLVMHIPRDASNIYKYAKLLFFTSLTKASFLASELV